MRIRRGGFWSFRERGGGGGGGDLQGCKESEGKGEEASGLGDEDDLDREIGGGGLIEQPCDIELEFSVKAASQGVSVQGMSVQVAAVIAGEQECPQKMCLLG